MGSGARGSGDAAGVPSETAPADRPSKRQLKRGMRLQTNLKIETLEQCFGPIIEILEIKCRDEKIQAHTARRVQRWLDGQSGTLDQEQDMREGFEACEALDEAAHKFRAFEDKGDPDRRQRAADYHDEWIPGVVRVS